MPSINRVFPREDNSCYHIYNRGNNKQLLFRDSKDYWVFRKCIKKKLEQTKGFSLLAFALMPNHFHLLLYEEHIEQLAGFVSGLSMSYSIYFRKKYVTSGKIFGGSYRAVYQKSQEATEKTRQYILNNPLEAGYTTWKHVGTRL